MSKTIASILNTLGPTKPLSIEEMSIQFRCPLYDVVMTLLSHGFIQLMDKKFLLTKMGHHYCGNVGIADIRWPKDICNLVLHTLLFSKNKCPPKLGALIERHYHGEQMIASMEFDGNYTISIKMVTAE